MPRSQKVINLFGVVIPFVGFLASILFLWGSLVTWRDLTILVVGYLLTCLGISIGFHRLFTHRAYETFRPIRYGLAVLGSMAVQGPILDWVADHRKHHAHTDQDGDPHSPHVGHGHGFSGLWHAHTGWLFETHGQADWKKYAAELYEDPGMRRMPGSS